MAVTASLVVQFGSAPGEEGAEVLQVLLDGRPVSEGGRNLTTEFVAGGDVYYLVYKTPDLVDVHRTSAGNTSFVKAVDITLTELVPFADTVQGTLSRPVKTLDSVVWLGNDLGSIVSLGGLNIRAATLGIGMAQVTYTTTAYIHKLSTPALLAGSENYSILIVVTG